MPGTRHITPEQLQLLSAPARNPLAPRGGAAFDGTSGARSTSTLTGQQIGTDPFAVSFFVKFPLLAPTTAQGLGALSDSVTSGFLARGVDWGIAASGAFYVSLYGATTGDRLRYDVTDAVAAYPGAVVHVGISRPTSGPWEIRFNGVLRAASTANSAGSVPSPQDTITSTYLHLGNFGGSFVLPFSGCIYGFTLYNVALSAADVQEIYEMGGEVPERFKFGSQAELISNGDFSSGTGNTFTGWTPDGSPSTIVESLTGGPDGSRCLQFNVVGGAGIQAYQGLAVARAKAYRLKFAARSVVGEGVSLRVATGGFLGDLGSYQLTSTWAFFDGLVFPSSASPAGLYFIRNGAATGDYSFAVDSVSLKRVGAVLHLPLNDGGGFQFRDVSTNRLHALATPTGVSHVLPRTGPFKLSLTSATNGNQQLGGQVVIPANSQILRIRAKASTGTPTVTLGTASGGAQVVASTALSTSWQVLPIALTNGLTGGSSISLWAYSNTAATIEWELVWEPIQ